MQSIWLVGGDENARHILSEGYPLVSKHTPVLMPHVALEEFYQAEFNLTFGAPSTGFVGELGCLQMHIAKCMRACACSAPVMRFWLCSIYMC